MLSQENNNNNNNNNKYFSLSALHRVNSKGVGSSESKALSTP
jgi:hypothetical protein